MKLVISALIGAFLAFVATTLFVLTVAVQICLAFLLGGLVFMVIRNRVPNNAYDACTRSFPLKGKAINPIPRPIVVRFAPVYERSAWDHVVDYRHCTVTLDEALDTLIATHHGEPVGAFNRTANKGWVTLA